jgi:hypothetical protein
MQSLNEFDEQFISKKYPQSVVVGYGRRNPNEPRKKYGKKNKSRKQGY